MNNDGKHGRDEIDWPLVIIMFAGIAFAAFVGLKWG